MGEYMGSIFLAAGLDSSGLLELLKLEHNLQYL